MIPVITMQTPTILTLLNAVSIFDLKINPVNAIGTVAEAIKIISLKSLFVLALLIILMISDLKIKRILIPSYFNKINIESIYFPSQKHYHF